jgi:uncharacterized membrane protein
MKNFKLRRLTFCGILAAVYAAVTIATASFSYGPIQFRLSEALCILPWFAPWTTWGLVLGCLLANLFSTVTALDVVVGTAATLLGCLLTAKIRCRWLVPLPTILCNGVLVGAMLALVLAPDAVLPSFFLFGGEVAAGEAAVLYALGLPLLLLLDRHRLGEKLRAL